MHKIRENFGGVIACLVEILIGILLLINPAGFTSSIIIGLGVILLLAGLSAVIAYFRAAPIEAARGRGLAKGLCAAAAGLFCIMRNQWFIATFPLLTILYGVAILATGIMRVQWAVDMLRLKKSGWHWYAIGAVAALVFALIILVNPFQSTAFLWTFVAVSLIVEAVLDVISLVITGRKSL